MIFILSLISNFCSLRITWIERTKSRYSPSAINSGVKLVFRETTKVSSDAFSHLISLILPSSLMISSNSYRKFCCGDGAR